MQSKLTYHQILLVENVLVTFCTAYALEGLILYGECDFEYLLVVHCLRFPWLWFPFYDSYFHVPSWFMLFMQCVIRILMYLPSEINEGRKNVTRNDFFLFDLFLNSLSCVRKRTRSSVPGSRTSLDMDSIESPSVKSTWYSTRIKKIVWLYQTSKYLQLFRQIMRLTVIVKNTPNEKYSIF